MTGRSGDVVDQVEACLARLDTDRCGAIVHRRDDAVLAEARALHHRIRRGDTIGPLAGLCFTVKAALQTGELAATAGSLVLDERIRRAADAVLVGVTNCAEFAHTYHPAGLRRGTATSLQQASGQPPKAHALRFATARRRATKRSSDLYVLYVLYRLASSHLPEIADGLAAARWGLRDQVAKASAADLADVEQALADLRAAPGLAPVDGDDFLDVIAELLNEIGRPQS